MLQVFLIFFIFYVLIIFSNICGMLNCITHRQVVVNFSFKNL